jgi:hypothetical protein
LFQKKIGLFAGDFDLRVIRVCEIRLTIVDKENSVAVGERNPARRRSVDIGC